MTRFTILIAAAFAALSTPAAAQESGPCLFNAASLTFAGTPAEQARCLLRPVLRQGELGEPRAILPAPLDGLVGTPVTLSREKLGVQIDILRIAEADIGGRIDAPLSQTSAGKPALYFVIHDTSTPNLLTGEFPADINEPTWRFNTLDRWRAGNASVAHVFIARTGASTTAIEFSRGWRATKLEMEVAGVASRGRFLHVENVQPRRSLASAPAGNDAIAPEPGFTEPQLRRLAIIYIAASVRAGVWLIPAFHAALDGGLTGAHDDPQNFDLDVWARLVGEEIAAIEAIE